MANRRKPTLTTSASEQFVDWVAAMNDADPKSYGAGLRRCITLTEIIDRAVKAQYVDSQDRWQ